MKEKRKGPISIAGGFVDSVAATVRRMQRDREPRALAYDPTGYARLIQPEARGHERILEIAEEMVALAAQDGGRTPDCMFYLGRVALERRHACVHVSSQSIAGRVSSTPPAPSTQELQPPARVRPSAATRT